MLNDSISSQLLYNFKNSPRRLSFYFPLPLLYPFLFFPHFSFVSFSFLIFLFIFFFLNLYHFLNLVCHFLRAPLPCSRTFCCPVNNNDSMITLIWLLKYSTIKTRFQRLEANSKRANKGTKVSLHYLWQKLRASKQFWAWRGGGGLKGKYTVFHYHKPSPQQVFVNGP